MANVRLRAIAIRAIAILLPFLALAIVELVFRMAGVGADTRLFVKAQQPGYWTMNPDVSKRYFTNMADATIGSFEPFPEIKPAGSYRVFVIGESTALGYPYLRNGSFHRWLQYRLQLTFPEKKIEIINLALTAVNSFTIRDFADELSPYAPDAVLIYVGHNEYYGALGVSSTNSLGNSPTLVNMLITLRRLHLVQWLTSLVAPQTRAEDKNTTLMQRMSDKSSVAYGSEQYRAGLQQYNINMRAAIASLQQAGIPVFWSTVVCNDKDLKPFIGDGPEPSANTAYAQGARWYAEGDMKNAKNAFLRARLLDRLRFRAPDSINTIIRSISSASPNVTLVDTEKALEALVPGGILGEEFFLEHVHPNLRGYALLADGFYEALRSRRHIEPEWKNYISYDSIVQVMPVTAVDSLKAQYEIMMLREQWPFNEPMPPDTVKTKTEIERLAGALAVKQIVWGQATTALLSLYKKQGSHVAALRTGEALVLENPENKSLLDEVAGLALQAANPDKAIYYARRSFAAQPSFAAARILFIELLKKDLPDQALPYLIYAAQHSDGTVDLRELVDLTQRIAVIKSRLSGTAADAVPLKEMAGLYLRFANKQAALKCVDRSLQLDPHDTQAQALRKMIVAL